MHYLNLIADRPLIWILFLAYMPATAWLAWLGHKKTDDIRSFAIGRGDLHPAIVGITLAAAICSTATFLVSAGVALVDLALTANASRGGATASIDMAGPS